MRKLIHALVKNVFKNFNININNNNNNNKIFFRFSLVEDLIEDFFYESKRVSIMLKMSTHNAIVFIHLTFLYTYDPSKTSIFFAENSRSHGSVGVRKSN